MEILKRRMEERKLKAELERKAKTSKTISKPTATEEIPEPSSTKSEETITSEQRAVSGSNHSGELSLLLRV
uniref:Uncharacterized protein n=1 Tax=Callorhinchus milii TaxID=7868 RepID=A0A4W3J371_CALMI